MHSIFEVKILILLTNLKYCDIIKLQIKIKENIKLKNTEILKLDDESLELCSGGITDVLLLAVALPIGAVVGWFLGEGICQLIEEVYRTFKVSKDKKDVKNVKE